MQYAVVRNTSANDQFVQDVLEDIELAHVEPQHVPVLEQIFVFTWIEALTIDLQVSFNFQ